MFAASAPAAEDVKKALKRGRGRRKETRRSTDGIHDLILPAAGCGRLRSAAGPLLSVSVSQPVNGKRLRETGDEQDPRGTPDRSEDL